MTQQSSVRSRVGPEPGPDASASQRRRAWIAPSVIAACAGALVAGALEGWAVPGALGTVSAAGFVALLAVPALLAGSVAVRALVIAWRPHVLREQLIEEGGAMPRLAGWVATIWLGALALAWTIFQGTWLLASWTAFKPLAIGFAQPVIAVATVLVAGALSRPAARLFAAIARAIDGRWRARGRRTLLSPRVIVTVAGVAAALTAYAIWRVMVRPRLPGVDPAVLHAPVAGIAVAWLVHVTWPRLRRGRAALGLVIVVLATAAIAAAIVTASSRPGAALAIWGSRPLAGVAIERYFDVDALRDHLPLAELAPTARPGAPHPDLVIVTLGGVRADRTPSYGGPAEMPALQQLAARGMVFEYAFTPSSTRERSLPALVTGTAANRVRSRTTRDRARLDPRHVLLAERLRGAGYDTAAFVCCPELWSRAAGPGLHRGFAHLVIEPDDRRLAAVATAWLDDRMRRAQTGEQQPPLLLWVHLDGARGWAPAELPPELTERERLYDRALAAADGLLSDVLGVSGPRAPLVIVTSDGGESLGDHEQVGHGTDLHNAQVRVPLVIAGPGVIRGRTPDTVSLVDLVPTVLDLAGYEPPTGRGLDGRSFADLARGNRRLELRGGLAFATMPQPPGERSRRGPPGAVIQGRWKLIENGPTVELYDLHTDPGERANHGSVRPEIVNKLRKLLEEHRARARHSPF